MPPSPLKKCLHTTNSETSKSCVLRVLPAKVMMFPAASAAGLQLMMIFTSHVSNSRPAGRTRPLAVFDSARVSVLGSQYVLAPFIFAKPDGKQFSDSYYATLGAEFGRFANYFIRNTLVYIIQHNKYASFSDLKKKLNNIYVEKNGVTNIIENIIEKQLLECCSLIRGVARFKPCFS